MADQVLLRAHTSVFQKKPHSFKVAPKDQRLYGVGRRTAAVSIHMCVWQNHMSTQGLHQGSKRYNSLADQLLLRAYTYVCQQQPVPGCTQGSQVTRDWPTNCENMSSHGCTQGPRDTSVWPTMCCCEHTRVCCRIYQFRVAPKCQGSQWFGRSVAAAHVTCVLQKKSTQGWFGRPHPDRKTHMCAITRVWLTKKYTWLHARI